MAPGKLKLCSAREIAKMRRAGLIVWLAHQRVSTMIGPGVTTAEINEVMRQTFKAFDAEPLFLNYPPNSPNPFPAETCISVNEQIVHGIPGNRKLKEGDIVSVDTGCRIDGWCGDAAVTHAIGAISPQATQLLQVTREALNIAIEKMPVSESWSQVAKCMDDYVRPHGYGIVEELVGHGIGRNLHQPPDVPNYYSEQWASDTDFRLRPGVVLAIEPMINQGTADTKLANDGWTIISADRTLSAHFEHTVALTTDGAVRLTGPPDAEELAAMNLPDPSWLGPPEQWLQW